MQNKYKCVIVFTLIVAISIASIIAVNLINHTTNTPAEDGTTIHNIPSTTEASKEDIPEEETTTTVEDKNNYLGNSYDDVLQQILGENNKYETVFGPSNVGAKNPYETDVQIQFDGETVTIIYETETTTIEEETTISPDTTLTETTTVIQVPETETVDTIPSTNNETTAPVTEAETTHQTTLMPETTITPEEEETTGSSDDKTESQPIDNSQSEDSI